MTTVSLREALGMALIQAARENEKVVVLDSDVAHPTRIHLFQHEMPERFLQNGIAEQNMVGVAAGLASCGWIPVVVAFAAFLVRRCFDQIYNSVCFPRLNVKFVGSYSGFTSYGTGASHQSFDDVAIISTIPNMTIINVGEVQEVFDAVQEMISLPGPCYLRVPRIDSSRPFYGEGQRFSMGKVFQIAAGPRAAILSTGIMTAICHSVVSRLRADDLSISLYHVPTLKPLDREKILEILESYKQVFTIEDNSVLGGLGGIVNQIAAGRKAGARVTNIGIQDRFGKCGKLEELFAHYGISEDDLYTRITRALSC